MTIATGLEGRHSLREREAGFTLIELLVVVIIIGILAAIAIPIYLGVTNGAKDSGVKADLANAKTAITGWAVQENGLVPATVSNDQTGTTTGGTANPPLKSFGWSRSTNTSSLTYRLNGTGATATWCLDGVGATGSTFRISLNTSVASGTCTALTAGNY